MKLQMRFLLLLTIVFAAIAGLVVVQRDFDVQRSQHVLRSELHDRKALFASNLTSEGDTFQTFSEDYSFWDDMVNFVKSGDQTFAHVNLDSGLATFNADVDWVYGPTGKLVYTSKIDPQTSVQGLTLPSNFFSVVAANKFAHFYMQLPGGTFEIRAATIVPGNDPHHLSPASGFWVIGRYLGSSFLTDMSGLSQSSVTFSAPSASGADSIGSDSVRFSTPLKDLSGNTVQLLNSRSQVSLIDELNSLYKREVIFISALGAFILVLILLSLWWLVLRPLSRITQSIQKQCPDMLNHLARSHSQFGSLAGIVQQFFTQKLVIEEDAFKKAELERLNKDKSAFLAVAAHELKSPTAIIKLIAEDIPKTAAQNSLPAELLDQLEIVVHQATKMSTLVSDLRLASEGKEPTDGQMVSFDFDEFLRKEVAELSYIIDQKIVQTGATDKTITADADHLSQVVSNLIRNAAKYSPDASEIQIKSSATDHDITFEIIDGGVGISPEDQAHIFERFYRAPSVVDTYQGLGLGLSICKTIIDRMHGKIWVESTPGQGSHFFVSLPTAILESDI